LARPVSLARQGVGLERALRPVCAVLELREMRWCATGRERAMNREILRVFKEYVGQSSILRGCVA